jgi:nucleoside-diphosphate-sugar epimerase
MGIKTSKRVLVTGSSGFIGRRLVKSLRGDGFIVEEFDINNGDISTYGFNYPELDHIVHLASMIFVPASWDNTKSFYQTNVIGTINLLELCRKVNCPLTYISSYVYGTPQYLPVDENHPINPLSPYNHSKLLAEEACRYYSETFNFPVTIFRPVNIYGPGQNPIFLIPKIIQQTFDSSVECIEVMDLRPKRDFLFIDDFITAIRLSFKQTHFNIYNIGTGYSVSVEEILTTILEASGINKPYSAKGEERKNETWDVYADISKIKNQLSWVPNTTFKDGIKKCIEEYKTSL